MKTITVSIDKVGRPVIAANGFTDASCKAATKPIEDALMREGEAATVEDKAEAHIPAATHQQHLFL